MAEIEYRGKCFETNEWIYGCLITDYGGAAIVTDARIERQEFPWVKRVSRVFKDTVGQYTGLKDKNGTEIYEGDIVKVIHEDGYETIGQVEWGLSSKWFGTYPAFAIRELESEMNSFAKVFDTGQYTIEVIGNIYEDKHLLD